MSISEQIQALTADRTAIKNAIISQGGVVSEGDGFDDFASAIGTITTGRQLSSHTVTLGLIDNTTATINVDYSDSIISTIITSYVPETYNDKTVVSGALDGVVWFESNSTP